MALLDVKRLSVSYAGLEVLHGVDLYVDAGEIVCLIGANGAGKTTLLRALSRLVDGCTGEMTFAGSDLARLPAHVVPALGIAHVPEGRRVFPDLTVAENLRAGHFASAGRTSRGAQLEQVLALFPVLRARYRQLAGTLSGGEQQMLAMGRAMMSAPRLLLLDEPSLGLAPLLVEKVFELIGNVNRAGTSVLLVEQNAFLALELASRGYVLQAGAVRLSGPASALTRNPEVQDLYLGG